MSSSAANLRISARLLAAIAPALLSTPAWAAAADPAGAAGDVSGVLVPEASEDQGSGKDDRGELHGDFLLLRA